MSSYLHKNSRGIMLNERSIIPQNVLPKPKLQRVTPQECELSIGKISSHFNISYPSCSSQVDVLVPDFHWCCISRRRKPASKLELKTWKRKRNMFVCCSFVVCFEYDTRTLPNSASASPFVTHSRILFPEMPLPLPLPLPQMPCRRVDAGCCITPHHATPRHIYMLADKIGRRKTLL